MLVHLVYVSRTENIAPNDIEQILESSRRNNKKAFVTGCLFFRNNLFVQLLEGSRKNVNETYNRIVKDPRHKESKIIVFEYSDERICPDWDMGYLQDTETTRKMILKYSSTDEINFETISQKSMINYIKAVSSAEK
jgi:hypothetical protein